MTGDELPFWWPHGYPADELRRWAKEAPTVAPDGPAAPSELVDRAEPQRLRIALGRLVALETHRRPAAPVARDNGDGYEDYGDETAETACEDWVQDLVARFREQAETEAMRSALEIDALGAVVDGMIIWFEFKFDDHLGIYEFHENENFIEGAMSRRQALRLPPRDRPGYLERATKAWWLHLKKRDGGFQYDEPPQPFWTGPLVESSDG